MGETSGEVEKHNTPKKESKDAIHLRRDKPYPISYPTIPTQEGVDSVSSIIHGLLGDVTMPSQIKPLLEDSGEKASLKIDKRRVDNQYKALLTTPTMIYLRDEAADLYNRYIRSKGYGTADAYFVRQADSLHKRMEAYVKNYVEFGWGKYSFDPFNATALEIQTGVENAVTKMAQLELEQKNDAHPHIGFKLPESHVGPSRWDRESISFHVDQHGKITQVLFDEQFGYYSFCQTAYDLAAAYKAGAELSPSHITLLKQNGLINIHGDVVLPDDPSDAYDPKVVPLELIPMGLPDDLAEKFEDKSVYETRPREQRDFYTAGNDEKQLGPFVLTTRAHDYSELEVFLKLNTSEITNEDVYRLVGHYADILKRYPRVRKTKSS